MNEPKSSLLTSDDLRQFIDQKKIQAELITLADETPTVVAAAAAVDAHPDQIVKSVLFLIDGSPQLAVTNGEKRINYKRLAARYGVNRRRVKLANAAQVVAITGYPVGAVPPFGHRQTLDTVVDKGVAEQTVVYGGGGAINALIRLTAAELCRAVGNQIGDLVR